jgi:calcineurin-like phosphoesterase family protein
MATWFTSDLHLGHANVIGYCARPFADVDAMNAALIERWNATVAPGDTVYVVGDFSLKSNPEVIDGWLVQLHGEKHLIRGNHDGRKTLKRCSGWCSVHELLDLSVDGVKLRLCHYRLEDWRGTRIQLHGHRHGETAVTGPYQYDVGVDPNDYRPVSVAAIGARLEAARASGEAARMVENREGHRRGSGE